MVKYDASVEQSAFDAVNGATDQCVNHLDYIIANAGIAKGYPFVKDVKRAGILKHIKMNMLSVVMLYQATRDLLSEVNHQACLHNYGIWSRCFGVMRTSSYNLYMDLDSLSRCQHPVPSATYGASKSILNWYGIWINAEGEWFNTFVLDPGWA